MTQTSRENAIAAITTAPLYVSWNYTYACNFNCNHCYSRAPRYPKELSTTEYHRIVDQLLEAKVFMVGLGGGEPLIRRDCTEILRRMGEAGIATNITSNAWFLDDARAEQLAAARLSLLYLSLDSARADVHDAFRNRPGSFARVLDAIKRAVARGLKVKLSTVLTSHNADEVGDLVRLGEEHGIHGIELKRYRPAGNGLDHRSTYEIDGARELALMSEIDALGKTSPLEIQVVYGAESNGGVDYGCPCGKRSITIRPNGDVSPCAYGEEVVGNLMETPLASLWQTAPALLAMREGRSCSGLSQNRFPSNPKLSQPSENV